MKRYVLLLAVLLLASLLFASPFASPLLAAPPSSYTVTFQSTGGTITAVPDATIVGDYVWRPNLGFASAGSTFRISLNKRGPGLSAPQQVVIDWSSGLAQLVGVAPGDGSAVMVIKIIDSRNGWKDTVTVTPIP